MKDNLLHALIIDDDPEDRQILQAFMARIPELKLTLHVAGSWEEARIRLRKQPVDMIFLDYYLGGITGLDVLGLLRTMFRDMPIIMMTGNGDELLAAEVMRSGADDYLVKGRFDQFVLKKSIYGVLERSRLKQEKVLLEAELRQAQKMECMGVLASGIAHDFNNILSPILGYAQLALEIAQNNQSLKASMEGIISAVNHARDLILQIHRFCRKTETSRSSVKLQSAIQDMLRLVRTTLPSSIDLQASLSPDCKPVMADETQIYQILMNLCTNAALAMQEDRGILRIILSPLSIGETGPFPDTALSPGEYTWLSVQDTGCGMTGEIAGRIFDPFFTTRSKERGTGMGLSVVYGIVREHDGKITVDSRPGEGTTFHVYFPSVADTPASRPKSSDLEYPPGNGNRLLLVDDNEQVLDVQKMMLERIGYHVTAFGDSEKALAAFNRDPAVFDCIVSDIDMPKMDGIALFRQIRKRCAELPVIFCTGIDDSLCQLTPEEMTHCGILTKPIRMRDMAQSINNLLSALSK